MLDILKLTKKHCPHAFLSLLTNGDLLDETLYRDTTYLIGDAYWIAIL